MAFADELRDCVELILGVRPPDATEPGPDPLVPLRQWLAGRNLGLVPVAEPAGFDWAGHWIARVRSAAGDHAIVMFGSPSGLLHDPGGSAAGGAIVEGWVPARLDLHLPIERPYGDARGTGAVAAIMLAPAAEATLIRVDRVEAVAGRGLHGDRYHDGRGTFSGPGQGYELTLVEVEVLDELGLPWEEARRNIATRGIDLNALVGRRFSIGGVVCAGRRLAEPCAHLERVSRPGLLRPLVHRGGLRADIERGGPIALGDRVAPMD